MTGAASDPPAWQAHIGKRPKNRRELQAKRAKNPNDALKIVIVRDMWLTGFDAPCMHTMYVDKPMKGHGLMQAIARVNRVFRDKPAGLVVDYIGVAQNLKSALGQYAGHGSEEVGLFQAVRAALVKSLPGDGKRSAAERELAIQQLVSRAVVSTEIVDIMKAAGLESPDISILSDEFLAEVRNSDRKNFAIEALKKLINGNVRSQSKRNVTQSKVFSERLEAAIARYHANAITTAEVLEELIRLAKDILAARARGEEMGLSDEESALYHALAENDSARQVMGEQTLRVIAHELVTLIKGNVSVD